MQKPVEKKVPSEMSIKKIAFFSAFFVYVGLFHCKDHEKNLFFVMKVKLQNLHIIYTKISDDI